MGFLRMIGLVTAEEHANLKNLFDRVAAERNKAFIDKANAEEAADIFKQQVKDTCARAEKAEAEVMEKGKTIFGLEADIEIRDRSIADLNDTIDRLRPDAEATRKRRQADKDRAQGKRHDAKLKAVVKDTIENGVLKTGKATGKLRTAIPAKVGKTASANLSGNRPAKKAAGK